jgi:hypothetical protein
LVAQSCAILRRIVGKLGMPYWSLPGSSSSRVQ